jgi:hypothetical protein
VPDSAPLQILTVEVQQIGLRPRSRKIADSAWRKGHGRPLSAFG